MAAAGRVRVDHQPAGAADGVDVGGAPDEGDGVVGLREASAVVGADGSGAMTRMCIVER